MILALLGLRAQGLCLGDLAFERRVNKPSQGLDLGHGTMSFRMWTTNQVSWWTESIGGGSPKGRDIF